MMESPAKRPRHDDAANGQIISPAGDAPDNVSVSLLRTLKPTRVLSCRTHDKFIALLAKHSEDDTEGILLLEKTPFPSEWDPDLADWVSSADFVMQNDIYHKLNVTPSEASGFGRLKVTAIHPATAKQIAKFEMQATHLFIEPRTLFDAKIWPFIEKTRLNTMWVDNILNGTAEKERVIFNEDGEEGFVLLPDLKWDGRTLEDMYCLAIVRRSDLTSLRDLKGEKDIKLLRHIGSAGRRVISERYSIKESQLRVYLHYPPTFYHLHVHFTHVDSQIAGQQPERAHMLDHVISNLEMMPDYYQKAAMMVRVGENDPLYELMSAEKSKSTS